MKSINCQNFKENFQNWFLPVRRVITIEPIVALYIWSSLVCHSALIKLEQEKACKANFKFNDTFCDRILNGEFSNSTQVQQILSLLDWVHLWQTNLETFIPLILVAIVGAVSDKFKVRKPFLVLAFVGELLSVIGCILCVVFMKEWRVEIEGAVQIVVPALFGGPHMILSLAYAYISDISSMESRTFRIGIIQVFIHGTMLFSEYIGGILVTKWTYIQILSLTGFSLVITILLTIFWLYEEEDMYIVLNKQAVTNTLNPKYLFETLHLIVKNAYTRIALVVLMGFFIDIVYNMVLSGEYGTFATYAFAILRWNTPKFIHFFTFNLLMHLLGLILGLLILIKWLRINDSIVLALVFLDKAFINVIFGVSSSGLGQYIASASSMIVPLSPVVLRSMATKVVSSENFGKIQVLFSIRDAIETICALLAANIYTVVYFKTANTYPSAFWFLGSGLYILCLPMIYWLYTANKNILELEKTTQVHLPFQASQAKF